MTNPQLAEAERTIERGLKELTAVLVGAYDRRDWQTMGYPSWGAYLEAEYGEFADMAAELVRRWRP